MLRSTLIAGAMLLAQCGLNSAEADIILEVSDDGNDLSLKWTGTMDVGVTGFSSSSVGDAFFANSTAAASQDGSGFISNIGTVSGNDPWIVAGTTNSNSNGVGTAFGFGGSGGRFLIWDDSFGATPGVIAPDREWTFAGLTVATAFGTNLDAGPVLLWTNNTTNDTISVGLGSSAAVPEPSSFALLGLGGIGFLVRRRRKSRAIALAESHCAASKC